jgi:hypothetical protein
LGHGLPDLLPQTISFLATTDRIVVVHIICKVYRSCISLKYP